MLSKNKFIINYITYGITYRFEFLSKKKTNDIHLNKSIGTDWIHVLDKYWDEGYIPYSNDFDLWPEWLFQYYNELTLGESIESAYLM